MAHSALSPSYLRVVGSLYFIVGGVVLVLMSLMGFGPSLWYFISFCLIPIIGIVWAWKPQLAAAFSIGPLTSALFLLQYFSGMLEFSRIWACTFIAGLVVAATLVFISLRGHVRWLLPAILSYGFVVSAFIVDKWFTNKVSTKTYQMRIALDGKAPWGDVGPEGPDRSAPIVLYRNFGNGYCYDAFQSDELRKRLTAEDRQTVTIVYNIFSDFSKERSYNVQSVDGIVLADGQKLIRDWERSGGQIMGNGEIPTSTDECH